MTGVPGLAVPACIVGGIGGLLYWQNITGQWGSWSYAWTLILGFVGVGVIVADLLSGKGARSFEGGGWLILISLLMFAIFGSFFGALGPIGEYWPVLLILMGVWMLFRSFLRRD
jgi:hypothetical protein